MVDDILERIRSVQKDLDLKTEQLCSHMKMSRSEARRKVRRTWKEGCILCNQQGPRELHFYKEQIYVICTDCYLTAKMELGEKELTQSIARRLTRKTKTSQHTRRLPNPAPVTSRHDSKSTSGAMPVD
jgi:hypothetical protein